MNFGLILVILFIVVLIIVIVIKPKFMNQEGYGEACPSGQVQCCNNPDACMYCECVDQNKCQLPCANVQTCSSDSCNCPSGQECCYCMLSGVSPKGPPYGGVCVKSGNCKPTFPNQICNTC